MGKPPSNPVSASALVHSSQRGHRMQLYIKGWALSVDKPTICPSLEPRECPLLHNQNHSWAQVGGCPSVLIPSLLAAMSVLHTDALGKTVWPLCAAGHLLWRRIVICSPLGMPSLWRNAVWIQSWPVFLGKGTACYGPGLLSLAVKTTWPLYYPSLAPKIIFPKNQCPLSFG